MCGKVAPLFDDLPHSKDHAILAGSASPRWWSAPASAADPAAITSQKSTWQYAIEWRLVRAGTASMTWTPEPSAFQGDLHIESAGLVSKLYRVNDDYRVRMREQFCASTVNIHAEEGKAAARHEYHVCQWEGMHTPSET